MTALQVAIVPAREADLDVALALAQPLDEAGAAVRVTSLPLAGAVDVLLIVERSDWPAAWYCHPGPPLAATLASILAAQATAASAAEAPPHLQVPQMPCDYAGAGAGPLVSQLSLTAAADTEAALAIGSTLRQFLARNAAALRQAKEPVRLTWPARGPVTNYFGEAHPLGIDIGQTGGPVVAASEGVVRWAGGESCCSYGLYVIVDGPGGISTLYAHLASLAVRTGDRVRRGQRLGEVGCTGRCFGPHLHFEVMKDGRRIDPLLLLP